MRIACIGLCLAAGLTLTAGCELFLNITEESIGSLNFTIINNTRFRAVFTVGTYDDLDRVPPGPVELRQFRLENRTTQTPFTLTCGRDVGIGTEKLVERIRVTESDDVAGFDDEALNETVSFSSAPLGSEGEGLPDAGTADGITVRLGVDYSCDDNLIFTFEEDASAPGGFRIDYELVRDVENDS